ncbi:MAG: hypothetical protein QCH35_00310 [Methanomicrobiaceae archaeon]|nr:hypothetical protein [Methanomicrobiaceae archaeon]
MRTALLLISLLLAGALLLTAGCTEEAVLIDPAASPAPPAPTPAATATPPVSASLSASVLSMQQHITTPPYWMVTVRVDNRGAIDAYHVITRVRLIDEEDGTQGTWTTESFERISAGDHKTYTVKLYGEKGRQYRAEVEILSSQYDR